MSDAAARIAAAYADTTDLGPAGDWEVVSGVPCQHIALPYPWATTGRVLALPTVPSPDALAQVTAWLSARSPQWTLMVWASDAHEVTGFRE